MFGEKLVNIDKWFRSLQFKKYAIKHEKHLLPKTKKSIQAYCDGINDFV